MPSPVAAPAAGSPRRRLLVLGVLLVAAGGLGVWYWTRQPRPEDGKLSDEVKPDLVAAARANARGIAYITYFDQANPKPGSPKNGYQLAAEAFEEAVKHAPDWTPAKVNLGIALLNDRNPDQQVQQEQRARALKVFAEVLAKEPDNPYAHFCSGCIHHFEGRYPEALKHFEAVTRIDPNDAQAWYYRGASIPNSEESQEAKECFENALKLNPYLNLARYKLFLHTLTGSDERRKQLIEEHQALGILYAEDFSTIKYSEMGRYGEVIGKPLLAASELGPMPMFEPLRGLAVKLAEGTTWAADDKLDELRKAVRSRFGGGGLLFDYNRDEKPDVLLLGAVLRDGKVRDLLLRNDGNVFTDVSAEVGLSGHAGSFGGSVGDFDNDGRPDLVLAGPAGLKLFRNADGQRFEDKTAEAGFDKEPGVYLTAAWLDLDLDSDLELIAAKFAQTPDLALKQLRGEKVEAHGRLVVFVNAGMASPAQIEQKVPLTCSFKPAAGPNAFLVKGPVTGVVFTDIDGDHDTDLVVLLDGQPPVAVLNDRLLRFHRGDHIIPTGANWNGGLVLDANGDDQPDLLLVQPAGPPRLLVSRRDDSGGDLATRFGVGATDSPTLRSAAWADIDLDGRTDVVGLSSDRKPVYLQGDGKGKLAKKAMPFGLEPEAIPDLLAVVPADLDGDGNPDVLTWSAGGGVRVFRNVGNGNKGLKLTLSGKWKKDTAPPQRTNTDGIGCRVRIQAGAVHTAAEYTTLAAGLGQSCLPVHFGLGKANAADLVRILWPDSALQGEFDKAAGSLTIVEWNRKGTSCPILFAWDGERFAYVTDFLGAGSMGESNPDGTTRPPRPEESVKIEPGRLVPRDGKFVLKVAEPMDEVLYLDWLRLDVIDHPADLSVFPDERFATSDPQPTQERLFFRDRERLFAKATDHRGRDVTAALRERDGRHADDFAVRSWLGYAEDHFVELDFGPALKSLPAGRRVFLVLAGYTNYAYPESIYAATQAGLPTAWPVLEQRQSDGSWKNLGEVGIPAGLTRVMTREVTGWIDPNGGPVRIRTNLQIYWDQVFLAPLADRPENQVRELTVSAASLEHRGFVQEYSPGGKPPIAYDYDRLESVIVSKWRGKVTRTGDVTELLKGEDDRFVICGPGDEVTAEFDAGGLPPVPAGWKRSFVLRSRGYCKDTATTTQTGGNVHPLPYRGMPGYPYDPARNPPPAAVTEYDRAWNTRPVGRR